MDPLDRLIFCLDAIGKAILDEKENERRLYSRYKALNPGIPNDPRDSSHAGIMEGLDRAWNAYHAAHEKYIGRGSNG